MKLLKNLPNNMTYVLPVSFLIAGKKEQTKVETLYRKALVDKSLPDGMQINVENHSIERREIARALAEAHLLQDILAQYLNEDPRHYLNLLMQAHKNISGLGKLDSLSLLGEVDIHKLVTAETLVEEASVMQRSHLKKIGVTLDLNRAELRLTDPHAFLELLGKIDTSSLPVTERKVIASLLDRVPRNTFEFNGFKAKDTILLGKSLLKYHKSLEQHLAANPQSYVSLLGQVRDNLERLWELESEEPVKSQDIRQKALNLEHLETSLAVHKPYLQKIGVFLDVGGGFIDFKEPDKLATILAKIPENSLPSKERALLDQFLHTASENITFVIKKLKNDNPEDKIKFGRKTEDLYSNLLNQLDRLGFNTNKFRNLVEATKGGFAT